jgi:hypothetical protein
MAGIGFQIFKISGSLRSALINNQFRIEVKFSILATRYLLFETNRKKIIKKLPVHNTGTGTGKTYFKGYRDAVLKPGYSPKCWVLYLIWNGILIRQSSSHLNHGSGISMASEATPDWRLQDRPTYSITTAISTRYFSENDK